MSNIDRILEGQKLYFQSGETLPVIFRIEMLRKLKTAILKHEDDLAEALFKDLGKSKSESYMCEIGMVLSEISYMINHVEKFAAKQRVRTPLAQFYSVSYRQPSPYGNTLIMSPWNYPVLLTFGPLVDAIAAGNTAILKPSAYSAHTSELVKNIIEECFPEHYIAVVTGGRKENASLLEKKFDFIFFTGSTTVGKEVLRRAAEHVTPVVLELGGKSPCIVDSSAKIKVAAKRIVFGKYLNCGQTCVAPDYVLCDASVKEELVKEIRMQITRQFGVNPLENKNYGRIVNEKHFDRLLGLIDSEKVVHGGSSHRESLQIAPTVMDNVTWSDAVMQEEIFGPILPVLTFEDFAEVYTTLKDKAKPLALYIFSENKANIQEITERVSFGGGCVNDTIIHLATSEMGFGGVGESGMGSYHGRDGFLAFSHTKSIVDKKTWLDIPMRYQPYTKAVDKMVRMFLK